MQEVKTMPQTENKYATKYQGFLHGCDYNPEQWQDYPDILEKDVQYMKDAHCNVVSLGIFSWANLEPEEGHYDFTFMDSIVERLAQNDIQIILATPQCGAATLACRKISRGSAGKQGS